MGRGGDDVIPVRASALDRCYSVVLSLTDTGEARFVDSSNVAKGLCQTIWEV